jgi:hypothetical protein
MVRKSHAPDVDSCTIREMRRRSTIQWQSPSQQNGKKTKSNCHAMRGVSVCAGCHCCRLQSLRPCHFPRAVQSHHFGCIFLAWHNVPSLSTNEDQKRCLDIRAVSRRIRRALFISLSVDFSQILYEVTFFFAAGNSFCRSFFTNYLPLRISPSPDKFSYITGPIGNPAGREHRFSGRGRL